VHLPSPTSTSGHPRGETLHVLVPSGIREVEARDQLEGLGAVFHRMPFGDIWMRDIAPIFVRNQDGDVAPVCFAFNGWGGKYLLDGDELVAGRVGELTGGDLFAFGFVLEGGAIEVDGEARCYDPLVPPEREPQPGMGAQRKSAARRARRREHLAWRRPAQRSHRRPHRHAARFVERRAASVHGASGVDDPNREVLEEIATCSRR
jgi:agmatine deiminase